MQSTLVLLAAPEAMRGRARGILSACIRAPPLGTLWIGFLATSAGVPMALAADSLLAPVAMLPVAVPLARQRHAGHSDGAAFYLGPEPASACRFEMVP